MKAIIDAIGSTGVWRPVTVFGQPD